MSAIKRRTWRFVDDGERDGAGNMARDESLARSVAGGTEPVLRLYGFSPPAVTIGRFQRIDDAVDIPSCSRHGIDVVRRPTGGLAILHKGDVTYSVAVPVEEEKAVKDACFRLAAGGIVTALALLGIKASLVDRGDKARRPSQWCFGGEFGVDIEWRGRKICGSAQRVSSGSVLQHGSMFVDVDDDLVSAISPISVVTSGTEGGWLGKVEKARPPVTLTEAAGRRIECEEVKEAFRSGFEDYLEVSLENGNLSEMEEEAAGRLLALKYSTRSWLFDANDFGSGRL